VHLIAYAAGAENPSLAKCPSTFDFANFVAQLFSVALLLTAVLSNCPMLLYLAPFAVRGVARNFIWGGGINCGV